MPYVGLGKLREALAPGVYTDSGGPPDPATGTAADLPDAQLLDAIAEADANIDAALGGQYVTPVPVDAGTGLTPHPIDYWSRAIAAYFATCTFRGSLDFSNDDPVYRRYAAAMAALASVAKGTYALTNLTENTTTSATAGAGQVFNRYSGNLFAASDFNLTQAPIDAGIGRWWGPVGWER